MKLAKLFGAAQINTASDVVSVGSLIAGQHSSFVGKRGRTIQCNSGRLWLTQEGDFEDHILEANESFRLRGDGLVVLSGKPGSSYRVA